jgi:hypothetical protein
MLALLTFGQAPTRNETDTILIRVKKYLAYTFLYTESSLKLEHIVDMVKSAKIVSKFASAAAARKRP